jgi:selenocysteine-specific elongation factor
VFVIGTAGHVDHGKSTLVQALTGINPDRLREEQERQMTIDLGFAWLTLPSGREVSMVDVPGHEDFIKNMLAGVGGIDLAMLVIAADEAVMPQTREHVAILDLLQVSRAVVALTKCDTVQDPEWLDLVQEEVREELLGTVFAHARIIPVSAVTGVGLPELRAELDRLLDSAEPRRDVGRPRLPIDRVFTISGFGTVVTGTLIDGHLTVGDDVQILPEDLHARIRGLQTHKTQVHEAMPGSRVAVNLTGVTTEVLRRGQVLTHPGWLEPTALLDAHLRLLPDAPGPLKHDTLVDFFVGASVVGAHVRLLDVEALQPGQEGWVQLRLVSPVAVARGDRYILRLASPSITLGGGRIVQPHAERRHRRFRPEVLAQLEALSRGTPEDILLQLLGRDTLLEVREIVKRSNLQPEDALTALRKLVEAKQVLLLTDAVPAWDLATLGAVGGLSCDAWRVFIEGATQALRSYHERFPLRLGMPREELKSRLRVSGPLFNQFVDQAARAERLVATPAFVRLPEYRVLLSAEQQRAVDGMLASFRANPLAPPSYAQAEQTLGSDLLQVLLEDGRLIKASDDVLFESGVYAEMENRVVAHLREHHDITVAQVRDLFGTSRKYALGLLEDLDRRHVTKRLGDVRVLR